MTPRRGGCPQPAAPAPRPPYPRPGCRLAPRRPREEAPLTPTQRRVAARTLLLILAARFAWEALRALDVFADYHAYYRAAANLRAGADLYAEGKLLVARNSYDFWTQTDGQYVYPPAFALALLPLTLLGIGKAASVWLLALLLATLAFIWLAARCLGRPVGLLSYLIVACPVGAFLPLALGVRYGLIARRPLALAALLLATYLLLTLTPRLPKMPPGLATSLPAPAHGGHPPQWARSRRGAGRGSQAPPRHPPTGPAKVLHPFASSPLRLCASAILLALAALTLVLASRIGRLDPYLLALALPGLVGTALLPWLRHIPLGRAADFRADLDALLPPAIATLGATPLLLGLRFGQADILLLALTTLALLAHLGRRDILAGVALGAAAAVKPTLALYGLYFARKRAWATLAAAALTGLVVGLGPFLLLGRAALADWLAISRYFASDDYGAYPSNQSLRGLLLRTLVGGPQHPPVLASPTLVTPLWLLAALATLVLWWRTTTPERTPAPRAVADYALTAALILVVAPLSEDIHHVAILLPLAFLAHRLLASGEPPPSPARGESPVPGHPLAGRGAVALPALALLAYLLPPAALALVFAAAPYLFALLLTIAALLATRPR